MRDLDELCFAGGELFDALGRDTVFGGDELREVDGLDTVFGGDELRVVVGLDTVFGGDELREVVRGGGLEEGLLTVFRGVAVLLVRSVVEGGR